MHAEQSLQSKKTKRLFIGTLLFALFALLTTTSQIVVQAQPVQSEPAPLSYRDLHGHAPEFTCELEFVHRDPVEIALSRQISAARQLSVLPAASADIQVTYAGAWDTNAKAAFEHAVSIWETQITSSVPILVTANWTNLGSTFGGNAGPENYFIDFANAPKPNTWYPVALANSLAGTDLDPGFVDIVANINSDFTDWYYGIDGNPGSNKLDLVSVVMHELGHGLGFGASFDATPSVGTANWGAGSNNPDSFDTFVENGAGVSLVTGFQNHSAELFGQVTSNDVWFDGPKTLAFNNNNRARLYAPTVWTAAASSIGHLDDATYDSTANALMTHDIGYGEAHQLPGSIVLGILADSGWEITASVPTPPALSGSSKLLESGTTNDNAIDLWALASDNSGDANLTFVITNGSTSSAISGNNISVTLDSNRYLDISTSGIGTLSVQIRVSDPDGLQANATITITSIDEISTVMLPILLKQ